MLGTFTRPERDRLPLAVFAVGWAAIAALALWQQRRALRYAVVDTDGDPARNYERVRAAADAAGWDVVVAEPGRALEARVAGFPRSLLSWGESVSVRFEGRRVYVNSICDPDEAASVTS